MEIKNKKKSQIITIIIDLIVIFYATFVIYSELPTDCLDVMAQPSPDYDSWKSYAILFLPIFMVIAFVYDLWHMQSYDMLEIIHDFLIVIIFVFFVITVGLYEAYGSAGFQIVCRSFL